MDEEELRAFKADQYIGAIFCKNRAKPGSGAKGCDGFYREVTVQDPPGILDEQKTGKALIPTPVLACSVCGHKPDPVWRQQIEDKAKQQLQGTWFSEFTES